MSCPICGKPVEQAWRPFCSKRCADLDLARWLGGGYRISSGEDEAESLPDQEDGGKRDES
ncbi:DNA gyrase inhibitor YacG [Pseudogemmobacter faecipullorum]|uniref:DNA gyrase inhibitor YacG n=1 Tax=Pseudogemmobacter faecipullorum TaxID=2755041 RepID=A0ABS8CMD3_9RHOB|nr:DNA gyrase inhibitor YacG [Pseudogemmobacter faecipullorum]MCB5410539.1 DNA gyrase inhibitor YacG [Pseudogemmobacter faecipullorum]